MAVIIDVKEAKITEKIDHAKKKVEHHKKNIEQAENDQDEDQDKVEEEVVQPNARQNWKKLFAVRKFLSLAQYQSKASPAQLLVANRYIVGKKIANGAFGQLRLGKDNETGVQVAIKLESIHAKIPMLFLEHRFYKSLTHGTVGVPKIHHFGTCGGKYNALVMDLLGPNLEELFNNLGRRFSLKTVLMIAIQLLARIEHIHGKHLIYRDIKPENCLIGRLSKHNSNIIHIVDFGLAKQYIDPETGRHINYAENKNLTGTVRYMSVNAHQGKEQSRRDDLEALGYVFFYFLTGGNLPWQGIKSTDDGRKRYQIIGRIKEQTEITDLCNNHPWEFGVYLRYCKNLRFAQVPDYSYLRSLFRGCLKRNNLPEDYIFDWHQKLRSKSKLSLFSATSSPASNKGPHDQQNNLNTKAVEPVEVKKLLDVDSMGGHNRERRCSKSLPNSLYNSVKDPSIVSSISMIEENKNEVNKKHTNDQQPRLEVTNIKKESKQNLPRVIPVVKIIPALSEATTSPAKITSTQETTAARPTQRSQPSQPSPTTSTSKNVLNVPNGGTKARKLKQPTAPQADQDNYGTMTLKVNPMYKRSASEVAKNSNLVVTCNTCFPLFKKLVK